jgi:hypothetical protein
MTSVSRAPLFDSYGGRSRRDGDPLLLLLLDRTERQIQVFETGIRDIGGFAKMGESDANTYNAVSALLVLSAVGRIAGLFTPLAATSRVAVAKQGIERAIALYGKAENVLTSLRAGAPDTSLFFLLDVVQVGECARAARTGLTKLIDEWKALKNPRDVKASKDAFAYGELPLRILKLSLEAAAKCGADDPKTLTGGAKAVGSTLDVVSAVSELSQAVEVNRTAAQLRQAIGQQRDGQLNRMRQRLNALYEQRAVLVAQLDGSRSSREGPLLRASR